MVFDNYISTALFTFTTGCMLCSGAMVICWLVLKYFTEKRIDEFIECYRQQVSNRFP